MKQIYLLLVLMTTTMITTIAQTNSLSTSIQAQVYDISNMTIPQLRELLRLRKNLPKKQRRLIRLRIKALKQTTRHTTSSRSCPALTSPVNGILVGKKRLPGHDIHFICNSGYQLVGNSTLTCLDSGKWSLPRPRCQAKKVNLCKPVNPCAHNTRCIPLINDYKCKCGKMYFGKRCQKVKKKYQTKNPVQPSSTSENENDDDTNSLPGFEDQYLEQQSRTDSSGGTIDAICVTVSGVRECSCIQGFRLDATQIPYRCKDIDECDNREQTHSCQWQCLNAPGSYTCRCPPGYALRPNRRTCRDIDECHTSRRKMCAKDQFCHNTNGGHVCIDNNPCGKNYTLTSHSTCTRIPCYLNDISCKSLAHTVSYNYMSLPANIRVPVDVFKLTASLQQPANKLQFMIYSDENDPSSGHLNFNQGRTPLTDYFQVDRRSTQVAYLRMIKQIKGPTTHTVTFELRELSPYGSLIQRYLSKIIMYVSEFEF